MIVVTRYRVPEPDADAFGTDADAALAVLAARPGFVDAWLGCNTDEPDLWTITLVWQDVRAYRHALSAYEVKVGAVPLLSRALDEPSAYVVARRWRGEAASDGSLGGS